MVNIELNQIHKKYDNAENYSVTDFNLHIEDREFIVFVGPSGCGKSTTLRMIAGLEDITEGELKIGETVMNDVAPKDRDIAMVFQNYALYPHMTVFDNMAFGLKLRKYKKEDIKQRVDNAADILGLTEYLDRKPAALSGGQRQRVALGRAIVRDAKVFLMDEPLSNLDAKLRVAMRAEIAKLHRRLNTTTIYVTHDQTEAMTMASRIVVMKGGFVQQIGTPKEIYNNPDNMFVASFVGAPATNFMRAKIVEDHFELEGKKYRLPDKFHEALKAYDGKNVVIGVRPENLLLESDVENPLTTVPLDLHVEVSELLGHESILHGMHGTQPLIAKIQKADVVKNHEDITLYLDLEKSYFFDEESEKRIYCV